MKRLLSILVGLAMVICLALSFVVASTPSAEARPKITRIANNLAKKGTHSNWTVVVRCSYSDPASKWQRMKPGEASTNSKHCGKNDADRAMTSQGNTCVVYFNPIPKSKKQPVKNGVYRMFPANWYKFPDYSNANVRKCTTASEKRAKQYPLR